MSIYSVQVAHAQDDDTLYLPFVTANGAVQSEPAPRNLEMPVVTENSPGQLQITIPDEPSPVASSNALLIEGSGPVVTSGSEVTIQYEMVSWDDGALVESSKELNRPFTMFIGDDIVPSYLEESIVGQKVGSRVLVILGTETMDLPTSFDTTPAYVLAVDIIDTYTPEQTVFAAEAGNITAFNNFVSESSPTDGLELGGILFNDVNQNGIQDGVERGIRNVEILLYADTDGDNQADGVHLAVANTGLSGNYLFTGLADGDYVTRISPWYFHEGRPLADFGVCQNGADGTWSILVWNVEGSNDPDNDVDGDNNGIPRLSLAGERSVRTDSITLQSGSEPTSEDGNADTNLTLDFCFASDVIDTPTLPSGEVDLQPIAVDDIYVRQVNTTVTENILTNDTAGNGPLLVRVLSGEIAPGLTLNPGGDLIGTVTTIGTYVFEYEISDYDGDSSTAFVTVTVQTDLMPDAIDDIETADAGVPFIFNICANDDFGDGFGSVSKIARKDRREIDNHDVEPRQLEQAVPKNYHL